MGDAIMHRVCYRPVIDDGDRIELWDDERIVHSETDENGCLELWTVTPIDDSPRRAKSDEQLSEELATWRDDHEIKADGGTETIDKSQTVREAAQPVVTALQGCKRSDHCNRLAAFIEDRLARPQLDYEDLMYPCRCHRDDGLVLRVEDETQTNYVEYGAGDLFYWMTDDDRTMQSAIDVGKLWRAFRVYHIDVEPVVIEDTPFGEDSA